MNREETANLLTAMAALDRRTIGTADVIAWQSLLTDVAFEDGLEAIKRHYAEHTEWMMPAHVRRLVVEIIKERDDAARATGYAPGQYGVPKEHPMPEIKPGGPYELMRDVSVADADVAELLAALRAKLPEGSREALRPRTVAWEREQRAFVGVREAGPNPLYKPPTGPVKVGCPYHEEGGYGFKADCGACAKVNATPGERAPLRECVVDGDGHCQTHDRHVSSCPLNGRG